jgi:hypothetical protein
VAPACPNWPPAFSPDLVRRLLVRGTFFQGGLEEGGKEELWESRTTGVARALDHLFQLVEAAQELVVELLLRE